MPFLERRPGRVVRAVMVQRLQVRIRKLCQSGSKWVVFFYQGMRKEKGSEMRGVGFSNLSPTVQPLTWEFQ